MHLGIDPDELVSPVHAGIASLISFVVGGIVPVLLIVLVAPAWQVPVTAAAVVVMLALTGTLSALLARSPYPRAIARNVLGGSVALAITYGIGHAVGVAV